MPSRNEINDREFETLKLLYDEWKFRLNTYWSLLLKVVTLNFLLIFFPLVYEKFGVRLEVVTIPLFLLPLTGMILSILVFFFTSGEMKKFNVLNNQLKIMNRSYHLYILLQL